MFDKIINNSIQCIKQEDESLIFYMGDGSSYTLGHNQDCCETVYIADIEGDIEDIINAYVTEFYESANDEYETNEGIEGFTFYRLVTDKGMLCIRFNGKSNGYYSIGVDLIKT